MGMFDYLKCEYPLPRPEMQDRSFQTKSFHNLMGLYWITAAGRLLHQKLQWDNARPETEREWTDVDYHGDVWFYDFARSWEPGLNTITADDRLVYFRARFTEGQLQWIREEETEP